MTGQPIEAQAISRVADDYRRRGYDVAVEPSGSALPDFLEGFRPDIIARRLDDSVVIKLKVGTRTSAAERFREPAERIARQPGWRFSVVYLDPAEPDQWVEAEPVPLAELERRSGEAGSLLDADRTTAAFLLLWSTLEGGLRLLGQRAQLPLQNLPTAALIRELYSSGELSLIEYEAMMGLLPVRNRLVHGQVVELDAPTVRSLRELVEAVLETAKGT